jgi:hypothetical protein
MRSPVRLLLVSMLGGFLVTGQAQACPQAMVIVTGGQARLGGGFKHYMPVYQRLQCGETADLLIEEQSSRLIRRSGSIRVSYDGMALTVQIGLRPYTLPVIPDRPVEVSLDNDKDFRRGAMLQAMQIPAGAYRFGISRE